MGLIDMVGLDVKKAVIAASALEVVFLLCALLVPFLGWLLLIVFAGLGVVVAWNAYGEDVKVALKLLKKEEKKGK